MTIIYILWDPTSLQKYCSIQTYEIEIRNIHTYIYYNTRIYTHTHTYIYIYIHCNIRVYVYTHTHIYIYIYIYSVIQFTNILYAYDNYYGSIKCIKL